LENSKYKVKVFPVDERVKSRHSREGWNPGARNFSKRMDSRLMTSGMKAMESTFCDLGANFIVKGKHV
jgi:hypothetical protein